MKVNIRRNDGIISCLTLVMLILTVGFSVNADVPIKILPQPKSINKDGNDLVISTPVIRITCTSQNLKTRATEIATELGFTNQTSTPSGGIELNITYGTEQQAKTKTNEQGEQGYKLTTSKSGGIVTVNIIGGNEAGAYYGVCTLRQMILKPGSDVVIPQVTIKDWPTIKRRGLVVNNDQAVTNYCSLLKLNYSLAHIGVHGDLQFYKDRYMEACVLSGYKGSNIIPTWGSGDEAGKQAIRDWYEDKYNDGYRSITAMFDDLGVKNAEMHASIAKVAYEHLMSIDPTVKFTFCPPQYFGMLTQNPNQAYHRTADEIIPAGVDFFWSGREGVFSREITTEQTEEWLTNIQNPDRKPFIFDNQPIRWAKNSPVSPLKKRSADLNTVISGYVGNLNHEANWNYQNRNAETVLVTIAMYCWNPKAYNEYAAWDIAREYLDKTKNVWATENYVPVASDKNIILHEDLAASFSLPLSDANGDPLTVTILSGPNHGTLSGTGKERTYTPNAGYVGSDTITFKGNDGTADSNNGTVNITVMPETQAKKIAVNCGGNAFTAADGTQYAADYGYNSGTKTFVSSSPISGTTDDILYQTSRWKSQKRVSYSFAVPNGTYEVKLKWADPSESSAGSRTMEVAVELERVIALLDIAKEVGINTAYDRTFTVEVTDYTLNLILDPANHKHNPMISAIVATEVLGSPPVNNAPHANNASKTTDENVAVAISLSATDADGDSLTYGIVSQPSNGTLSGNAPDLTYTPDVGYTGSDSFTFKANDGQVDSNTATVSITVNSNNGGGSVIFEEGFESPDVAAYTQGQLPDNGHWVGSSEGYGAGSKGITDKGAEPGGDYDDPRPETEQAFAFRYTNSGVTTTEGAIGVLEADTTYTINFDVVMDKGLNDGTAYTCKLYAVTDTTARNDCQNDNLGTVLATISGNAPGDGSFNTVSVDFTPEAGINDDDLGKDLALRFVGSTTSAIIDNVKVEKNSIGGDTPHSADTNGDWSISQAEVNSFITAYNNNDNTVTGDVGSITSNRITMREVMRVIYLYNQGGGYIGGQGTVDGYDIALAPGAAVTPQAATPGQTFNDKGDGNLVVSSTADSGNGSLRDAIMMASDGETIIIDESLDTITFLSEIIIDKSITIDGQGVAIVSGENQTRIFRIENGDRDIIVTLKNMGIVDAKNLSDEFGGAVYNNSQTLNLDTVLLDGNKNTTENGKGGAAYSSGTLNVENCEFRNNKASEENDIYTE